MKDCKNLIEDFVDDIKSMEEEMEKNKKRLYIIIIAIIVLIVIDQITKVLVIGKNFELIPNILAINFEESIKGSFGVGQKGTLTFILTNIIVIGIIIKFIKMQKEQIDIKTYIALTMIISGALGNLIDRIIRGYVVKFIKIFNMPSFNIADILIILGWVLLAIFFATFAIQVRKENK